MPMPDYWFLFVGVLSLIAILLAGMLMPPLERIVVRLKEKWFPSPEPMECPDDFERVPETQEEFRKAEGDDPQS